MIGRCDDRELVIELMIVLLIEKMLVVGKKTILMS